jgi:hypothetical protein
MRSSGEWGTVARWTVPVLASLGLLATGCARSDLGAPCHLQDQNGAEVHPQPGREYLYLGSSECESFACLATPQSGTAYCSQPCSGPGASCPSGLGCEVLNLDPAYLATMKQRLPPDRYEQLFGQLGGSFYCVKQ